MKQILFLITVLLSISASAQIGIKGDAPIPENKRFWYWSPGDSSLHNILKDTLEIPASVKFTKIGDQIFEVKRTISLSEVQKPVQVPRLNIGSVIGRITEDSLAPFNGTGIGTTKLLSNKSMTLSIGSANTIPAVIWSGTYGTSDNMVFVPEPCPGFNGSPGTSCAVLHGHWEKRSKVVNRF